MTDAHHGPHCAGACEGAAYQIEIRKLRAENEGLREALKKILGWREVDQPDHIPRVASVLHYIEDTAKAALSAHDQGGE